MRCGNPVARLTETVSLADQDVTLSERDRMIQAKLLVVGGEAEAEEIILQLPATVGRSREATINLSHPLVSRQHCELFELNGWLMVRDLDSLNGTFVGSQRVSEAALRPGDLLTVGTVTFRAIYEPGSSGGPADDGDPAARELVRPPRGTESETEETHRLGERDSLEVRAPGAAEAIVHSDEHAPRPAASDH